MTDEEAVEMAVRAWRGELDRTPDNVLSEHLDGGGTRSFDGRYYELVRKVLQEAEGGPSQGGPFPGHQHAEKEAGARFEDTWGRTLDNLDPVA